MKVWVCKHKVTGNVIDVLLQSEHPVLFEGTQKTFLCTSEEWDWATYTAFKNPINLDPPVSEATPELLKSTLDKLGYDVSSVTKKILEIEGEK